MTGRVESFHEHRRVYLIDDLLGTILVLAAIALAILLDLTRRQVCALHQLAFALCATCAVFVVGGLVDNHLSNDQLSLALYSTYLSRTLTTWYVYIPVLASSVVSLLLLWHLQSCQCQCCCLAFAANSGAKTHERCFAARIRASASLYAVCMTTLLVAIGTRVNVRLRESAINPIGGTVHWMLLRSPFYLALAHIGSILLVALKLFLQHVESAQSSIPSKTRSTSPSASLLTMSSTTATTATATTTTSSSTPTAEAVHDLLRSPRKPTSRAIAQESDNKSGHTRSPRTTNTATAMATPLAPRPRRLVTKGSNNQPPPSPPISSRRGDGDVSSLISSDSDSDEDVLAPQFPSSPTLSSSSSSTPVPRERPPRPLGRGSLASRASSFSPPPSPTRSTVSTGSSSMSSSWTMRNGAPTQQLPRAQILRVHSSTPRPSSAGSSTSTAWLSDSEELLLLRSPSTSMVLSHAHALDYRSDYPVAGLRRRAPRTEGTDRRNSTSTSNDSSTSRHSDWVECFDERSGSCYYYNTSTGESRWTRDQ